MNSVVSYPDRGPWGNNKYRGNCSGYLIKDIIEQYHLKQLSDYMVGGGTTEDVCREMGIPGTFTDLNRGFDMLSMDIPDRPQAVFNHLPYSSLLFYSNNMYPAKEIERKYGINPLECDLSRCRDWDDFVKKMNYCILKQFSALDKGGRLFLLMGDWKQKGRLYSMVSDCAKPGTLEQIIIKLQHNTTSENNTYSGKAFVPIIHEYLVVLRKDEQMLIPVTTTVTRMLDMRDAKTPTWRDTVLSVLQHYGKPMSLHELYEELAPHKKAKDNPHWQAKVRQTVQDPRYFRRVSSGCYAAA